MTREQFINKSEELIAQTADRLRKETLRLFDSGGLDAEKYEDTYLLPKIVLTAALHKSADDWRPHDQAARREVANLRHF